MFGHVYKGYHNALQYVVGFGFCAQIEAMHFSLNDGSQVLRNVTELTSLMSRGAIGCWFSTANARYSVGI